ncbi:geraniol 8-hydroxylase-like [Macadamia integrifolia]|uniref:geraniol 8-hydroxylase-like n=1 Tax=Macadamia integrifolia TaxID=60698 RepID=UPI001C500FD1|nr:geraniol 8-hydroxylase-like [Macadamia integrifolia]
MDWFIFLFIFFFLLISIHGLLHLRNHLINPSSKKFPPGPTGLPILGNLVQLGDRPHESLTQLATIHGPLMTVRLGFVTTIVASSVNTVKEILQTHDQAFMGRSIPDAATAETGHEFSITWLSGGPRWRNLRKLCNTQIFTTQRLDSNSMHTLRLQIMEDMVKSVVEEIEGGGGGGGGEASVNVGRIVFGTSLNLLSNTFFSFDMIDDQKSKSVDEIKEIIWRIMDLAGKPNVADYFPMLRPFDPQGIRREIKVCYDRLHSLLEDVIHGRLRHRASGSVSSGDFLDVLLDYSHEHGDDFSLSDIKLLLSALFIGGTDTTTTTLEWAMAELLHNPTALSVAERELSETIGGGRSIKESDLRSLPYMKAALKESMRLHPTVPFLLPHRALMDVDLYDFHIPKHTQLLINAYAIARDPAYWVNPNRFLPERFLGSEIDFRGNDLCFIPFGAGRRMCPGLPLAERMMEMMLATLLNRFHWKLPRGMTPEEMDMKDRLGISLHKATPLIAVPVVNVDGERDKN